MAGEQDTRLLEVIQKVKNGDAMAFEYVIDRYKGMAFTIALRIVNTREDAEEVVQDAFFKAYRFLSQYTGDSKFSSWLYKIVFNTSLTRIKKEKINLVDVDEEMESPTPVTNEVWNTLATIDRRQYLKAAMDALSRDDALVITLYYLAENSVNEISEITGWQNSTVKVKLHHARKKLYDNLYAVLNQEITTLL